MPAVDPDARVIRGFSLAIAGPFKTAGRGEFDEESLDAIVRLARQHMGGLPSFLEHPNILADGPHRYLGTVVNVRREGDTVRGDLRIAKAAAAAPEGDLGEWLVTLAGENPVAVQTSLVLQADLMDRVDKNGNRVRDRAGNLAPPLWRPIRLFSIDVVRLGESSRGLLSVRRTRRQLRDPGYWRSRLAETESYAAALSVPYSHLVLRETRKEKLACPRAGVTE